MPFSFGILAIMAILAIPLVHLTLLQWPKRMTAMATYSSRLAPIVLPDPDGRETRLGSLWSDSAAVVVFLRHYG
jgi:hypothetical protein